MKRVLNIIVNVSTNFVVIMMFALTAVFIVEFPTFAVFMLVAAILISIADRYRRTVVKIKYFDNGIQKVEKISVGDWIDLRASETVTLFKGEYRVIPLGVGMILPDGYEAHLLPRSSTPDKFGIVLTHSMGVIDNSYSGDSDEWTFSALAIRDTTILKGDRIAQFRIVKNQPPLKFDVVDHLNDISRGGLGSTGKR